MNGFVVWFTGLSGAGKSTLAAMLAAELRGRGLPVELLDGDEVRTHLSKGLSFSREDRDINVRRIGYVAKLLARSGACAITAAISPYREVRAEQRAQIGRFVEVYVRCSLPILAERDVKGLYKKALAGEIKHFTGVDDPYEEPESPEVVIDSGVEGREEGLARIVSKLAELGYLSPSAGAPARRGRTLIAPHGGELVDRVARGGERDRLAALAATLPVIDLDPQAARDLDRIAVGAYSPLQGFVGSKDYLRIQREMRLENGLVWPLPITLPATEATAQRLAVGGLAALRAGDRVLGVIEVADVWAPDKGLEARAVFGTDDEAHPGVAALGRRGSVYVGGPVWVIERPRAAARRALDPREARDLFIDRGWTRIVAQRFAGVMDRGHEHLGKAALEGADGLFLQLPLDGDVDIEVRLRCAEAMIDGYYPIDGALVSVDPAPARHAGARETLLRALVARSFGASAYLVDGGDHAAAIAEAFSPGEIGVELIAVEQAFWSAATGAMATARTAPDAARAERDPAGLLRPEVARILAEMG